MGRDGAICPYGRDRAACTLRWVFLSCLPPPCSTHKAGGIWESQLQPPKLVGLYTFLWVPQDTRNTFGASLRAEPDRAARAAPGCGTQGRRGGAVAEP